MNINPSIPGLGIQFQVDEGALQDISKETIQQLAREELTTDTMVSLLGNPVIAFVIDSQNPSLPSPNYQLLGTVLTNDQMIHFILSSASNFQQFLFSLPEYSDVVKAGITENEIETAVNDFLLSNTNSSYPPDMLARKAIGNLMYEELRMSPTPALESAWYNLRADMLIANEPSAKLLISVLTVKLTNEGKTETEAADLARRQAVDAVDGKLSENGVLTPFYGMHSILPGAVLSILRTTLAGMPNAKFNAALLQDISKAGAAFVNTMQNAGAVSPPPGPIDPKSLETMQNYAKDSKELVSQILETLTAAKMDPQEKVAILTFMKYVAEAIAAFDEHMKELAKLENANNKMDTKTKIQTAAARAEAQIKEIKEKMKEYEEAMEKVESMKAMMGAMSVISDIISSVMMGIFGALFAASGILVTIALVVCVVWDVIGTVIGIAMPVICALLTIVIAFLMAVIGIVAIVIIVVCVCCCYTVIPVAVAIIVAIICVVVEVIIAVVGAVLEFAVTLIAMAVELAVMLIGLVLGIIALVIGAIFIVSMLVFILLLLSTILSKATTVMEDLTDAFGQALINLLDKMGINISIDTAFLICAIAPAVIVVVILLLPIVATLLVLILVPLMTLLGSLIVLPILAVMVIVLALIALLVAAVSMAASLILQVIFAVVMAVLVLILALLPIIVMALLIIVIFIIAVLVSAFIPALIMVMAQWMPLFLARSGIMGKAAKTFGGALGLSEKETQEMEQAFTFIVLSFTAMTGQYVSEKAYEGSASEQEKREESTEGSMQYELAKLNEMMQRIARYLAKAPNVSFNKSKQERLENEIGEESAELESFMAILRELMKKLQALLAAMAGGGDVASMQGALTAMIAGPMSEMLPTIKGMVPQLEDIEIPNEEALTEMSGKYAEMMQTMVSSVMPGKDKMDELLENDRLRYLGEDEEDKEAGKKTAPSQFVFS